MKKPTAVKIVEVLGWMEVVLVLYGVIWAVNAIVHGKCGSASDVWICMGISLVVLALPVGMVMSLRHGRRAGFIWPHSGVALFAVFALSMVLEMWCAAAIALILLVAVFFLLFRPEATRWFNEMSNGKKLDNYGCAAIFLTGLMYLLAAPAFVGILSELLTDGGMHGDMNLRMWDILSAMGENNRQREAGKTWIDPSNYTSSTGFLHALCAGSGFYSKCLSSSLGAYTNVWCIVVNSPDKSDFPILFTANLAPSDLFGAGGHRVSLTCPKEWGGECFDYCEKKAIVVRNGCPKRMQVLKPKNIHAISLPEESLSELADTYVLTPTGRIALVDITASPEDGEVKPGMDASYEAREGAVYKVLWWLKTTQQKDGSWNDGPCPVAATALGICAFLAHGEYPYSPSPYAKDFTGTVIAASEYVMGCVSETNGVLRIRGGEDDERSLPIVTMALCELYGMTRNPDAKENAVLCLRHLVGRVRTGLESGEWQKKNELLLWTAEALWAAMWSMSKVGALSEEEKSCQNELRVKVLELTSRLNDNGYSGGRRRYCAWMSAAATKKDGEEYFNWRRGKEAAFVKALKEDQEKIADTKGILHSKGFLSESIDAKPSGFGVSADSALGVMELMIGGGGRRNLPIIEESSDNAQPTNDDVSVSVEI